MELISRGRVAGMSLGQVHGALLRERKAVKNGQKMSVMEARIGPALLLWVPGLRAGFPMITYS